ACPQAQTLDKLVGSGQPVPKLLLLEDIRPSALSLLLLPLPESCG
ncbi:hypothetical protein A2U01_0097450, partial [Trifolium medium]|nr:hypothetical protein [Trifolium medium]